MSEAEKAMLKVPHISLKNWSRRRVVLSLSVVVIGVVLGRIVVAGYHRAEAMARSGNQSFGGDIAPWKSIPEHTDEYNEYMTWLYNMAKQRTPWTMPQVQRLLYQLNHPPNEAYYKSFEERVARNDPTLTWHDIEPESYFGDTVAFVADRIRRNEPIETTARKALVNLFVKNMENPRERIRDEFTSMVQYARLPLEPAIRAKMISLYGEHAMDYFDDLEERFAKTNWNDPWKTRMHP